MEPGNVSTILVSRRCSDISNGFLKHFEHVLNRFYRFENIFEAFAYEQRRWPMLVHIIPGYVHFIWSNSVKKWQRYTNNNIVD